MVILNTQKFPKVALEIQFPNRLKELLDILEGEQGRGFLERLRHNQIAPTAVVLKHLSESFEQMSRVSGWYELKGLSFYPSSPDLKRLNIHKPNVHPESYPIMLRTEVSLSADQLLNAAYPINFRGLHEYSIQVSSLDASCEKVFVGEDKMHVDFSRKLFLPRPTLESDYYFDHIQNGTGLKLVCSKK